MYRQVLCLIMGRGGSNAIARWVYSQYPEDLNVKYMSNSEVWRVPFIDQFFAEPPPGYSVLRQECVAINKFPEYANNHKRSMDDFPEKRVLYAWRDPWNHFAALFKWYKQRLECNAIDEATYQKKITLPKLTYTNNHKRVLRQALGLANYLPKNSLFLNYNRWFVEPGYRAEIATELQLPSSELEVDRVWNASSFESDQKSAQQLNVLERWREFKDDPLYLECFKDRELVELASQFWPPPFML
jgi:hypothetical protein